MATLQVKTSTEITNVFGEPVKIIDIKKPTIDDKSKEKVDGKYPQKHNVIDATFLKVVVFSLVDNVKIKEGKAETDVKDLEDSVRFGKLARKLVVADTTEHQTVDLIAGGKDDELGLIQEAVHNYYGNVEIDLFIDSLFNK